MNEADCVKLLAGPYTAPPLKCGDVANCLYRDCDVVITGWSEGRIPWPLCRSKGKAGGSVGLLVDEELARAVRTESEAAIVHWWGVNSTTVWQWRKALDASELQPAGSRRLRRRLNAEIGGRLQGKPLRGRQARRRQPPTLRGPALDRRRGGPAGHHP